MVVWWLLAEDTSPRTLTGCLHDCPPSCGEKDCLTSRLDAVFHACQSYPAGLSWLCCCWGVAEAEASTSGLFVALSKGVEWQVRTSGLDLIRSEALVKSCLSPSVTATLGVALPLFDAMGVSRLPVRVGLIQCELMCALNALYAC